MKAILLLLVFLFNILHKASAKNGDPLIVSGSKENDIVKILVENHVNFKLYSDPDKAIRQAAPNTGLLLLAENYPAKRLHISNSSFRSIIRKNLQVYIEYPGSLPGIAIDTAVKKITLERGVVTTAEIEGLDSLDLLAVNDHQFIPVHTADTYIVLGKVAGYDKADYGISDIKAYPLLFKHQNFIVASTKLSDAITSRFGPAASWINIWEFILSQLIQKPAALEKWGRDIAPAYSKNEVLPDDAFQNAIGKGTEWFYNARLLIHPSWQDLFLKRTSKNGIDVVYPSVPKETPIGDGSLGILEGHASYINADGSQPIRWWLRADCQAETAFALSSASDVLGKKGYNQTAANLLHYLYKVSNLRSGERDDSESPSFGLIGWATTDPDAYYGDDNARVILSTIGASANLNTNDWDKYIIEGILGNFRTAGVNGFRGPWFRDAAMQKTSWQALGKREIINVHPHYESWLWACYIWLYDKTGYTPLLTKAKEAIRITMKTYPDWKWTNGIQQEYARMVLPLAWLVRVEDTGEHRQWLQIAVEKLLEDMQESGAVREELGKLGLGRYGRIASNEEYGSKEAPLISDNGDPVADLLYTMNFAFFTLNEAAAAVNDPVYAEAVGKIADFMVRVQVSSPQHNDLNGAWFRAFDYKRWDYWASNADSGWGPWGTLTGWTQSWIINTLILENRNQNFWDNTGKAYKNNSGFKAMVRSKIDTMLND